MRRYDAHSIELHDGPGIVYSKGDSVQHEQSEDVYIVQLV